MREKIENILQAFAKEHRLNFASGIVPSKLAQGIKFPCVFLVLPDGEYSIRRARRTYRVTLYLVAGKTTEEQVTHSVDELESLTTALFERIHVCEEIATADTMQTRVKIGFDNSGAHAIEATFDAYDYGEC